VNFNANSFEIVFDNLLSNAIRYTPAGGQITLSVKKNNDSVFLEISDTGCGISAELKEKVFEKSFRSQNAQKISSEGAGLGLYMVKSIADLTNSRVWFDSEEGKGTTFYFSIPIR
jgi:two-component system, OmpR family, sensor histidine kinase VicK